MDKIKYKDINFKKMKLASVQGTNSKVYIDGDKCYKMLDGLDSNEKRQLLKKFCDMRDIKIDNIILPKELILKNSSLMGYTMDYFPQSINMYDYFTKNRYVDVNEILQATKKAAIILRTAHQNGIVLQDFSFDNILINNSNNVRICDIDGCCYNGYESPFVSMIIHAYYNIFMKKEFTINEKLDKQALLLSMLLTIYHKMIFRMYDYDILADKIKTLQNIRPIIESLLKNLDTDIPYLDEIICDNDHYMIDRDKQVPAQKRLIKDYKIY